MALLHYDLCYEILKIMPSESLQKMKLINRFFKKAADAEENKREMICLKNIQLNFVNDYIRIKFNSNWFQLNLNQSNEDLWENDAKTFNVCLKTNFEKFRNRLCFKITQITFNNSQIFIFFNKFEWIISFLKDFWTNQIVFLEFYNLFSQMEIVATNAFIWSLNAKRLNLYNIPICNQVFSELTFNETNVDVFNVQYTMDYFCQYRITLNEIFKIKIQVCFL